MKSQFEYRTVFIYSAIINFKIISYYQVNGMKIDLGCIHQNGIIKDID